MEVADPSSLHCRSPSASSATYLAQKSRFGEDMSNFGRIAVHSFFLIGAIMKDELIVVTGAGGFIGGAMIADFRRQGYKNIRGVDIKPPEDWYQLFDDVENLSLDLNVQENCDR